jgi:hypothetical protein
VSTLAGVRRVAGFTRTKKISAPFDAPRGVAVDSVGNVYVADDETGLIQKITPRGAVTTLAGSRGLGLKNKRVINGTGTAASFDHPWGVAVDFSRNVYVADSFNSLIREITPRGLVTTLAGGGGPGYRGSGAVNGTGTAASFSRPFGIAVDSLGNVYVADTDNCLIRKVTTGGVVTTLAGQAGVTGSTNGMGFAASFNHPSGIAVDASGNIYVADTNNNLIRKIIPSGSAGLRLLFWGTLLVMFREITHSAFILICGILLILFFGLKKYLFSIYSKLSAEFMKTFPEFTRPLEKTSGHSVKKRRHPDGKRGHDRR